MEKTILITGAGGQLGQAFARECARALPDFECVAAGRADLDIADAEAIRRFTKGRRFGVCVNCAAYTAVDRAESDAGAARLANALGPARLARACGPDTLFIHFSTDYVYHNRVNRPLVETDPIKPQSVYARTKLAGERALLAVQPGAMVIRASWIFAPWGHNFVNTMRRLGAERETLRVVCDQIGAPTYAPDLAASVVGLIGRLEAGGFECRTNERGVELRQRGRLLLVRSGLRCHGSVCARRKRDAHLHSRVPNARRPSPVQRAGQNEV